jgi:hypothetical protein
VHQTSKAKGDELEVAVQKIEASILDGYPSLRGVPARIERDVRFNQDGILIQIDVLVRTDPDTADEALHIFECKNWRNAVGSEEVQKLDSRRNYLKAASATLVCCSYTKRAASYARKVGIRLLRASEDLVPLMVEATYFTYENLDGRFDIQFWDGSHLIPPRLALDDECDFHGAKCSMRSLADQLMGHIARTAGADPRSRLPGSHTGKASVRATFARGELRILEFDVAWIDIRTDYLVTITQTSSVRRLGVESRGGIVEAAFPEGTGGVKSLSLEILTKPPL